MLGRAVLLLTTVAGCAAPAPEEGAVDVSRSRLLVLEGPGDFWDDTRHVLPWPAPSDGVYLLGEQQYRYVLRFLPKVPNLLVRQDEWFDLEEGETIRLRSGPLRLTITPSHLECGKLVTCDFRLEGEGDSPLIVEGSKTIPLWGTILVLRPGGERSLHIFLHIGDVKPMAH
jgi:hypothetical protein